jgi:hypothetical protein
MVKKELFIFLGLFLFLALGMHMNQWINHPLEHINHLLTHKMPYHPLLYTFLLYIVVAILRAFILFFKKLFTRL